jgi:hypothetical protein
MGDAAITVNDQMAGVLQKPVLTVGQVATYLRYLIGIGTRREPRDVDSTRLSMHHGEHLKRAQSLPCPHLDRGKVRCKDGVPVSI